jgi:hypothetical protein
MALEGGEARIERGDDGLLDLAVGKQANQVLRSFLVQLTGDEMIFAGKHPLKQCLRAPATRIILHAQQHSKNGASDDWRSFQPARN